MDGVRQEGGTIPTSTPNRTEAMVETIDPTPLGVDLFHLKTPSTIS